MSIPWTSLAFLYQALGCAHNLFHDDADPYAPPQHPSLTSEGFAIWQTKQLCLEPDKHGPILQKAVIRPEIKNPYLRGRHYSEGLPMTCLPSRPHQELSRYYYQEVIRDPRMWAPASRIAPLDSPLLMYSTDSEESDVSEASTEVPEASCNRGPSTPALGTAMSPDTPSTISSSATESTASAPDTALSSDTLSTENSADTESTASDETERSPPIGSSSNAPPQRPPQAFALGMQTGSGLPGDCPRISASYVGGGANPYSPGLFVQEIPQWRGNGAPRSHAPNPSTRSQARPQPPNPIPHGANPYLRPVQRTLSPGRQNARPRPLSSGYVEGRRNSWKAEISNEGLNIKGAYQTRPRDRASQTSLNGKIQVPWPKDRSSRESGSAHLFVSRESLPHPNEPAENRSKRSRSRPSRHSGNSNPSMSRDNFSHKSGKSYHPYAEDHESPRERRSDGRGSRAPSFERCSTRSRSVASRRDDREGRRMSRAPSFERGRSGDRGRKRKTKGGSPVPSVDPGRTIS